MRGDPISKEGLRDLIKLLPSGLVGIEVGSYAGESSSIFAESGKFKVLYCVDFWKEGYYEGRGTGEEQFDKLDNPIIVKVKINNDDILDYFETKIDFIYIDADHTYESVKKDINNAFWILDGKGIIAGHDYINTEANPFIGVINAVDEMLGKPDQVFKDSSWIKFL